MKRKVDIMGKRGGGRRLRKLDDGGHFIKRPSRISLLPELHPTSQEVARHGLLLPTTDYSASLVICSITQRSMSWSIWGQSSCPQGYWRSVMDMPALCNNRRSSHTRLGV